MGSDPFVPGLIWASPTGAFVRIFVTVPNRPLFSGLIAACETCAFVRIFVVMPSGPLHRDCSVLLKLLQLAMIYCFRDYSGLLKLVNLSAFL